MDTPAFPCSCYERHVYCDRHIVDGISYSQHKQNGYTSSLSLGLALLKDVQFAILRPEYVNMGLELMMKATGAASLSLGCSC